MSKTRAKAAKDLSARVSAELKALAMADATLVINLESGGQLGPHAADEISFRVVDGDRADLRVRGQWITVRAGRDVSVPLSHQGPLIRGPLTLLTGERRRDVLRCRRPAPRPARTPR